MRQSRLFDDKWSLPEEKEEKENLGAETDAKMDGERTGTGHFGSSTSRTGTSFEQSEVQRLTEIEKYIDECRTKLLRTLH